MPAALTLPWPATVSIPRSRPAPPSRRFRLAIPAAAVLAGVALGGAWRVPGTVAAAVLGWVAAVFFATVLRSPRSYPAAYAAGLIGHLVGFTWVFPTVARFGGFGAAASAAIFALFVATGALQFLLAAAIARHLGPRFESFALRAPTAVVLAELLTPRLFPWHWGHTQIAFTPLAQAAGLGGVMLVTFLVFWAAEAAARALVCGEPHRAFWLPAVALAGALAYGAASGHCVASATGPVQEVVIVQGNAPLNQARDVAVARRNLERLRDLTRAAPRSNALVVWPEGSLPVYISADVRSISDEPALPCSRDGSAMLVGGFAFDDQQRRYNAVFQVDPEGRVDRPYFKRVLIPFGEAIPFSDLLPWLGHLNARAGVFTPGAECRVFDARMRGPDGAARALRVAPLVCYEDTSPGLSREAVNKGANLLVNLTYDTWFGRTVAPEQHHLIAAFRAVENGRYLVRATNSGFSAVVDPLGRTVASIPPFTAGVATARVRLLSLVTPYTRFVGDRPWWLLLALALAGAAARRTRARSPRPTLASVR